LLSKGEEDHRKGEQNRSIALGQKITGPPDLAEIQPLIPPGISDFTCGFKAFRAAAAQNAQVRDLIVRYSELQLGQIQQTAACNALHDASSRLCRWLLQTSDKIGSDTIPFTHEFLAKMLGVRRSTVSQIASKFQSAGFIDTHRGQIKLLGRNALRKNACSCYEIMRQHIDRLVPAAG
jgi:hypothetical protein